MRSITEAGGVTCEPVGGGVTKVEAGEGLEVEGGGDITDEGKLNVNFSEAQKRVTGECPSGEAVVKVEEDGSVVCEEVGGSGETETGYLVHYHRRF